MDNETYNDNQREKIINEILQPNPQDKAPLPETFSVESKKITDGHNAVDKTATQRLRTEIRGL